MKNCNENSPTLGWTEDEQYDFSKMENKWLKEVARSRIGNRTAGVARLATDPTFSTIEEINIAFQSDILQRKETWKHLCHICDYATNGKSDLTKHLAVHGIGDRVKCDQCDKDFSTKGTLQKHIKIHNSCHHKCNQCGKMYTPAASLKMHIPLMHSEKRLECDECDQIFSTIGSLNHHKKRVHVLKSLKCDQCKFRSKTNWDLKKHINTVHNVRDVLKCDLCEYQGNVSDLNKHKEAVHENKKNWFCKACPYSKYFNTVSFDICEFTLAKNHTPVKDAECLSHTHRLQTNTVKIEFSKKIYCIL